MNDQDICWACPVCTFAGNGEEMETCGMCNTPRPSAEQLAASWRCPVCTFENMPEHPTCAACMSDKPSSEDGVNTKWNCAACTFSNPGCYYECQMCNTENAERKKALLSKMKPNKHSSSSSSSSSANTQPVSSIAALYSAPPPPPPPPPPPLPLPLPLPTSLPAPQSFAPPPSFNTFPSFSSASSSSSSFSSSRALPSHKGRRASKHLSSASSKRKAHQQLASFDPEAVANARREALAKERVKIQEFVAIYQDICQQLRRGFAANGADQSARDLVAKHISSVFRYVAADNPKLKGLDPHVQPSLSQQCLICYCDFDQSPGGSRVVCTHCKHGVVCADCFAEYFQHRVKDSDVMPWVPCPAAECAVPLHPQDIVSSRVSIETLYGFVQVFMQKTLAREQDWVGCKTDKCPFGFLLPPKEEGDMEEKKERRGGRAGVGGKERASEEAPVSMSCPVCGQEQKVERKKPDLDPEVQKLLKTGEMRTCPKCNYPTTKDYGMCNVMQCAQCSVWWNWRTREYGNSSSELKEVARMRGTLWERGELEYQMKLQYSNPEKFKELLERNGIAYDPHYRRGAD